MAAVDLVALLIAIPSGGASVAGAVVARTVVRELLVNALATGVSLLTYDMAVALDLPPWLATLAAMGVGLTVSVAGTRAVVRRLDAAGASVGEPIEVDLARPKTPQGEPPPPRGVDPDPPWPGGGLADVIPGKPPAAPDIPSVRPPDPPPPPRLLPEPDPATITPEKPKTKPRPEPGPDGIPDAGVVPPPISRVPPQVGDAVDWPGVPGVRQSFADQPGLEASTHYKVPGRDNFYTNAEGEIVFSDTPSHPGGKLNPDLRQPQPNATHVVPVGHDAHAFATDPWGRTVSVEVDELELVDAPRSGRVQQRVGHLGPDGLYDGGHLIANVFGGIPEEINMVPMLSTLNQPGQPKNFYALEGELRALLNANPPPRIWIRIDIEYPDVPGGTLTDSLCVPDALTVRYRVNDGDLITQEFDNVP
jgi:hypothetical protein